MSMSDYAEVMCVIGKRQQRLYCCSGSKFGSRVFHSSLDSKLLFNFVRFFSPFARWSSNRTLSNQILIYSVQYFRSQLQIIRYSKALHWSPLELGCRSLGIWIKSVLTLNCRSNRCQTNLLLNSINMLSVDDWHYRIHNQFKQGLSDGLKIGVNSTSVWYFQVVPSPLQ